MPDDQDREKHEIFEELRADPRYHDFVRGCLNCGVCTGWCPSHRFFDYAPRIVIQNCLAGEDRVYGMMGEYIWACAQCFSCAMVCPFNNNPGGVVAILREIAVRRGMMSAKRVLKPYSRVLLKVMTFGNQVSPDMIQPDFFPDWGPKIPWAQEDLELKRQAIPVPTLRTVESAWKVAESTMNELYTINKEAGIFNLVEVNDPGLAEVIEDDVQDKVAAYLAEEEAKKE